MMNRFFQQGVVVILAGLWSGAAMAQTVSKAQIKGLDEQVQEIKKDVLGIASELKALEEKLLYPSNTQVSVFVSLNKGSRFRLDAIDVRINGKLVAHHLYTAKELDALRRGGVQRIYTGNVKTGQHNVTVSYLGKSTGGGNATGNATYKINKGVRPKIVEVRLAPATGGKKIEFSEQ